MSDGSQKEPKEKSSPQCTCVQDPFADLPPELRPRPVQKIGGLPARAQVQVRKLTCPGCGLVYWTNRATDLCVECEKKGVRIPEGETVSGG